MNEKEYLEHIETIIKEIESIDLNNSWSYEQILHGFLKFKKLPIILFTESKGNLIFRSRINNGEDIFYNISDISIPDEKYVKNYARANKPRQALFYGSQDRPTSYMEFALHLAEITPFGQDISITVGGWELKRNLTFALIFNPKIPRNNEYLKYHGQGFDEFIKKSPEEYRMGIIRFFEWIAIKYSEQINDNMNNYLITCAYSNIVFAYVECDGIIYPSVPRAGDAFNVVIKKNTIDNNALELKAVRVDKFVAKEQKNGKHDFLNSASIDASSIEKDTIEWKNGWQQYI